MDPLTYGIQFLAFSAAALLSFLLAPVFIRQAHKIGFLDVPSGRKQHEKPTALFGGVII